MRSLVLATALFVLGQPALADSINAETLTVSGCTQQAALTAIAIDAANSNLSSDQNDTEMARLFFDRKSVNNAFEYTTDYFPTVGDQVGAVKVSGLKIDDSHVSWTMVYNYNTYRVGQSYDSASNSCNTLGASLETSFSPLDGIY